MNLDKVNQIVDDIARECHEDYVGLWVVVREVQGAGVVAESEIFDTTLEVISRLLADGKITAGNFNRNIDDKFHPWEGTVDQITERIKTEWSKLGRDPTGGDVVWFTAKAA